MVVVRVIVLMEWATIARAVVMAAEVAMDQKPVDLALGLMTASAGRLDVAQIQIFLKKGFVPKELRGAMNQEIGTIVSIKSHPGQLT